MTESPTLSFGEELRRERVVREISLEEIAQATKISIRLLTALENSELTKLPAPTFTRGFIRAYARHLGIDPEEKVNAYLADLAGGPPEAPSGKSARIRSRFWRNRRATAGAIVGGALLVLVVLGLIANPQRASLRKPFVRVAPPAAPVAFKNVAVSNEPTPLIRAENRPQPASPAPEVGPEKDQAPPAAAKEEPVAKVSAPVAPAADRTEGRISLVLEFDADSWAKIEADGRTVFVALAKRGERKSFSAREEFRLTLGNAGAVRVTVDGRALEPLGREGQVVKDLRLPAPSARG
jgi:cytoskeleton protein RodZ